MRVQESNCISSLSYLEYLVLFETTPINNYSNNNNFTILIPFLNSIFHKKKKKKIHKCIQISFETDDQRLLYSFEN